MAQRFSLLLLLFVIGLAQWGVAAPRGGLITALSSFEASLNADPPSYPWTGAPRSVSGLVEFSIVLVQSGPGQDDYQVTFDCPPGGSVNPASFTVSVIAGSAFPVNTSQPITVTLPAAPGQYTYTAKVNGTPADTMIGYVVKVVEPLQYLSSGSYVNVPDPLYVAKGSSVTFQASPNPTGAPWPSDPSVASPAKPVWSGTSGASGTGETKLVTFDTVSNTATDYKTVTAECGTTAIANVVVYDILEVTVDQTEILSGALDNMYHQCVATIQVTPVLSSVPITVELIDRTGAIDKNASLESTVATLDQESGNILASITGNTDVDGMLSVTITSSTTGIATNDGLQINAWPTDGDPAYAKSANISVVLPDNTFVNPQQ